MLQQEQLYTEIKSEKARKIVGQTPSFIMRIGITLLVSLFLMLILVFSVITIEPQTKIQVVLIGQVDEPLKGYLLIPYEKTIPVQKQNPIIIKINPGNFSFSCKADLNNKKVFINHLGTYWQVPLIIEKGSEELKGTILGQIKTYTQIKSNKTSILRWLLYKIYSD